MQAKDRDRRIAMRAVVVAAANIASLGAKYIEVYDGAGENPADPKLIERDLSILYSAIYDNIQMLNRDRPHPPDANEGFVGRPTVELKQGYLKR